MHSLVTVWTQVQVSHSVQSWRRKERAQCIVPASIPCKAIWQRHWGTPCSWADTAPLQGCRRIPQLSTWRCPQSEFDHISANVWTTLSQSLALRPCTHCLVSPNEKAAGQKSGLLASSALLHRMLLMCTVWLPSFKHILNLLKSKRGCDVCHLYQKGNMVFLFASTCSLNLRRWWVQPDFLGLAEYLRLL